MLHPQLQQSLNGHLLKHATDEWALLIARAVGLTYLFYDWSEETHDTKSWYSAGAWLCLRFPFPKMKWDSSVGNVGSLYGGSKSTSLVPHLDMQNMTYTSDGKKGFNQGASSEDLGPISSIDFSLIIKYIANKNAGCWWWLPDISKRRF